MPGVNMHPSLSALVAAAVLATFSAANAAADADTDHSASVTAAVQDTAITAKVKARIATDARLKGSDIDVATNNGVVTLTGSTASANAKHAAQALAGTVPGVHAVNNRINVAVAAE